MTTELRRSSRYTDFIPITISVGRDNHQPHPVCPLSGRIIDISNHGACLLMTKVMSDNFHFFHSTREDDSSNLQIKIQNHNNSGDMEIAALPVWFDAMKLDDMKVFRMGVDFINILDKNDLEKINMLNNNV